MKKKVASLVGTPLQQKFAKSVFGNNITMAIKRQLPRVNFSKMKKEEGDEKRARTRSQ